MKRRNLKHEFVEFIPEVLGDDVIYVSIPFATAAHKCCCGCGNKVVTPLSPTDWKLTFDGETVSLHPSIGNWSFDCRSHYWIERNTVQPAYDMSADAIEAGRFSDRLAKARFYGGTIRTEKQAPKVGEPKRGAGALLKRLKRPKNNRPDPGGNRQS